MTFDIAAELVAHRSTMARWALRLSGNSTDADDLVQETTIRALTNAHSFTAGTSLEAWLFTIMRNVWRSTLRKSKREIAASDLIYSDPADLPANKSALAIIAQKTTEHSAPGRLALADALTAIAVNTPASRDTMLAFAKGHSYREIAERTGEPIGTIQSRIFRTREMLAQEGV
jgi:RNA polymerase sigma-70 factor (ECF subfamily)